MVSENDRVEDRRVFESDERVAIRWIVSSSEFAFVLVENIVVQITADTDTQAAKRNSVFRISAFKIVDSILSPWESPPIEVDSPEEFHLRFLVPADDEAGNLIVDFSNRLVIFLD